MKLFIGLAGYMLCLIAYLGFDGFDWRHVCIVGGANLLFMVVVFVK